jgi:hypothetical protein
MNLCKYKDIFEKPNEKIHSYRLFNIALVDLTLTILLIWIIKYFNKNIKLWKIILLISILTILIHRLFCVNTTINKIIFGVI